MDYVWIVDSQYHEAGDMKQFTSYPFTINTEVNLLPVLTCDWMMDNIIKEIEAWDMKQFTSYPLITNAEVNLPTVLRMCELLIHIIIKEIEAWDMKQLTS